MTQRTGVPIVEYEYTSNCLTTKPSMYAAKWNGGHLVLLHRVQHGFCYFFTMFNPLSN